MRIGLTLGKFAPLHRGHQLVIETALAECDRVLVLIYEADETTIPLAVRARWIRDLYPAVEVIEAWDGPTEVGDTPEIERMHDAYIVSRVGDRGVTHFYSSESYGAHVSRALGAIDRRVDQARAIVPISATRIREDPYANRQFLSPIVYRDLIVKVVFLGAPSTGKTTMAEAMARKYSTVWMPEYGREYWEKYAVDRRLTLEQLVEIAETHRQREDALVLDAKRYLFVDTSALTTRLFSRYYHGAVLPRLEQLADESVSRYDVTFLCGDEMPYADTADRSGAMNRAMMQRWVRDDLERRGVAYWMLEGSVEKRMGKVREMLSTESPSAHRQATR